jgi:RNA polymerase sigma-70 factor (ECF subfamily)
MTSSAPIPPSGSSSDPLLTSRSLLQRARERDEEAWRELVNIYAPLVYFWCRRMNIAEQDIPDLVQDVFRTVVTGLETFRKERPGDTFRGWLRTVTRTKAIDGVRRAKRFPLVTGGSEAHYQWEHVAATDDEDSDEEEIAEKALFLRALETVRPKFDPQIWQAFWRIVVDGCSANEVAEELGMKPGTVRVAKCRVLQKLRQQLGDVE